MLLLEKIIASLYKPIYLSGKNKAVSKQNNYAKYHKIMTNVICPSQPQYPLKVAPQLTSNWDIPLGNKRVCVGKIEF